MDVVAFIRRHKATSALLGLALVWLLVRNSVTVWVCSGTQVCWLYPDDWPALLGIGPFSSPVLVLLVSAALFALPFGRSGLLATLVAIQLGEPVLGFWGMVAIFLLASAVSIVLTHAAVAYGLRHPRAGWVHARLQPYRDVLGPLVRRNAFVWLSLGNLVGSQWHMSALGILSGVRRDTLLLALMAGNVAGFALVYLFSQVPDLDAVSIVLSVLFVAVLVSSPVVWAAWKKK